MELREEDHAWKEYMSLRRMKGLESAHHGPYNLRTADLTMMVARCFQVRWSSTMTPSSIADQNRSTGGDAGPLRVGEESLPLRRCKRASPQSCHG
ncbi:hypothetical protein E2C01_090089 [Portunus trituberculatus]|uniref:Uncharacterized protein n=1 Tax=Portunus trituberculatus TaxID=210409 RepID=A0A5B7JJB2_PORTR|nr:hypothetical protein [Portunus trituberculatus]